MTQQQANTAPVKEFRVGGVKAAIWKNEVEQDGRTVIRYSVKIQRSYRDKASDEWKTTEYFFPEDLPRLILVAQKAFEYVSLRESEESLEMPVVAR